MNCYVLTGGESRRMGSPKPSLTLGERTFFQRIVEAAAPVFESVIEVTRPDRPAIGSIEAISEPAHEHPSPIFGIAAALDHAADAAWIVAADYPLLTSPALRYLRDRFERSDADVVVPVWNGLPQMLCAGYRSTALPLVRRRSEGGDFRLRSLLDDLGRTEIIEERELRAKFPGEPLVNVNTPEDLERVRRMYGG